MAVQPSQDVAALAAAAAAGTLTDDCAIVVLKRASA